MIPHDGLTVRKHMLTDVGHEKTCGKPEPYQHVEHRAEQPRERCEQVGSGSGPEPKRRQHWHLVPRPCLARALSHDHGVASPCSSATERPVVWLAKLRTATTNRRRQAAIDVVALSAPGRALRFRISRASSLA